MEDTDFDAIASDFEKEIYGSSKGYVRLQVLLEDLLSEIPQIEHGDLNVLDAGGGAGHMAIWMARSSNNVLLCDPSQEMLDKAEEAIHAANLQEAVTVRHSSIQNLDSSIGDFDVILCHAVLEWLGNPRDTLEHLAKFLNPHGYLSLMFYNNNAALMKRVFKGEFTTLIHDDEGDSSSRGPGVSPLAEKVVRGWLDKFGLRVRSKAGIRIFHDHLPIDARTGERIEDLLEVEKRLRKQEPFASLGQHIHLVCERTG